MPLQNCFMKAGFCDFRRQEKSAEVLIIYAFAVLLAQVVNDHQIDPESIPLSPADEMAVRQYFGSVQNTMLKPLHLHSEDFFLFNRRRFYLFRKSTEGGSAIGARNDMIAHV